jgi:hypothetical protein
MLKNEIKKINRCKRYLLICALLVCVMIIFWPSFFVDILRAKNDGRLYECRHNMFSLYDALYAYYDVYGSFPPSYTVDENGKRQHSWRVLILPYLELNTPLNYDYDQLWDSPHNQQFRDKMPRVFRCPYSRNLLRNSPSYTLITKENNIDHLTPVHFLLVEIRDAKFNWLEPVDFSMHYSDQPMPVSKSSDPASRGFYHDNWFNSPRTSVMTQSREIIYISVPIPIRE